jgi:Ribosomal protein L11 methyltransferase (PrmA)
MYSLEQFASMFADKVRMDAYSAAIERSVRPGDVVVDLGCGPGIFAFLACKAGARKVYAIDTNGIVDFGRHLAVINGFAERVHFLRGDSRQIHLPERANVIIADVRGVLPVFSHCVGTLEDARDRFLAEGGRLLPSLDTLIAAVVEVPELYGRITGAWKAVPSLELSSGLPLVLNSMYRQQIKPEQVVSQPLAWHALEYCSGAKLPAQSIIELPITQDAVGHGIGLWFETELIDGIGYSTAPQSGETVYGHLFFPWLEPVALRKNEVCSLDVRAHLVGNDYIWQWETKIRASSEHPPVNFKQSTFYGSLFPPSLLQKRTTDFVPVLNELGLAERWLLQAMDGKRPLEAIAGEAVEQFPHVFRRVEDAFNQAAELAEKYSR